jgi:hypothetical protein
VPGKNIAVDESIVGFKRKIIFETYNKKKTTTKKQRSGKLDYLY